MLWIYKWLIGGSIALAVIAGSYGWGRMDGRSLCEAAIAAEIIQKQNALNKIIESDRIREARDRDEIEALRDQVTEYENRDECPVSESDARRLRNIK